MNIKIYRTDDWTRVELDGELFGDGHNTESILQSVLEELGHTVTSEYIDEDEWDERFNEFSCYTCDDFMNDEDESEDD